MISGASIAALVILAGVFLYQVTVFAAWAFHVDAAASAMQISLEWSDASDESFQVRYTSESGADLVPEALAHLSVARQLRPEQRLPHALAFVAHMAQHDWQAAALAFTEAISRSASGSLPRWEANTSWLAANPALPENSYLYDVANRRLVQYLPLFAADMALHTQEFDRSLAGYRDFVALADVKKMPSLPFDLLYRYGVVAALSGAEETGQLLQQITERDSAFAVPVVDEATPKMRVDGARLRLMTSEDPPAASYGFPLGIGGNYGILPWVGRATTLVEVAQSGPYTVTWVFSEVGPAPVLLQIGVDGAVLKDIELRKDDTSLTGVEMSIELDSGFHTLDVWFLNDDEESGRNRDAVIAWVEIARQ